MQSKHTFIIVLLFGNLLAATAQPSRNFGSAVAYDKQLKILDSLLVSNSSFKDAVFSSEVFFMTNTYSRYFLEKEIVKLKNLCASSIGSILVDYHSLDSNNHTKNLSIYSTLTSISYLILDTSITRFLPYTYNHSDPFGQKDFTSTFVTKLLQTHKGNCRSLAYLYKILADELGAKCWLALAPNHIYIKNYSQKIGWYNTELTSGTFPTDAWIMTTGYVNPEAIKSGMYMDTLSNQQAIALCVLDLAKGYERQTKNYYDGFILKCCDLVLRYHPVNPMALLLKAETLKKIYLHDKELKYPKLTVTESQMAEVYITLAKLGYREMSDKMYQKWLKSISQQKEKYINKMVVKPLKRK